jgi:hypothetical protein
MISHNTSTNTQLYLRDETARHLTRGGTSRLERRNNVNRVPRRACGQHRFIARLTNSNTLKQYAGLTPFAGYSIWLTAIRLKPALPNVALAKSVLRIIYHHVHVLRLTSIDGSKGQRYVDH